MENPIQTRAKFIGTAEQTKQNDTKLKYKQELSNSKLKKEHNKNSETGMRTVGWSFVWHSAARVLLRREHPT